MDGVDALEDVTVLAATNRPDRIDKVFQPPPTLTLNSSFLAQLSHMTVLLSKVPELERVESITPPPNQYLGTHTSTV